MTTRLRSVLCLLVGGVLWLNSDLPLQAKTDADSGKAAATATSIGGTRATPKADTHSIPGDLLQKIADIQIQGITRPKQEAILRFPTTGIVQHLAVREGDFVKSGQLLLTLDDRVARAEVESAGAALAATGSLMQAKLEAKRAAEMLARTRQANSTGASSALEIESKKIEFQLAEAAVRQQLEAIEIARTQWLLAKARLQQMSLEAPISGDVVLINARIGNSYDHNMTAIHIADLTLLETELYLPSELFGMIKAGQQLTLTAGMPVNRQVNAKVIYVSPMIEPTSNTFLARMEIDNSNRNLPAGFEVWLYKQDGTD